jgi:hypothetical protein
MSQSLGTAQLSREAASFLRGGDGGAVVGSPAASGSVTPAVEAAAGITPPEPKPKVARPTVVPDAPRKPVVPPPPAASSGLVSLTFRLPSSLAEALLRVSLERKLRKEKPFAQQDIVAEALREWLERRDTGAEVAEVDSMN